MSDKTKTPEQLEQELTAQFLNVRYTMTRSQAIKRAKAAAKARKAAQVEESGNLS